MAVLREIADRVGVSVSTVSRALNNHPKINSETKLKIQNIAFELNYDFKSNLINNNNVNKKLVAIMVPDSANYFYADIIKGVEDSIKKDGYALIIRNTDGEEYEEREAIKNLLSYEISGLVAFINHIDTRMLYEIQNNGVPVVIVGSQVKGFNVVDSNNKKGAFLAAKHLIDLGNSKIAYISGELTSFSRMARFEGYKKALEDNHIDFKEELIKFGKITKLSGFNATKELMKLKSPPTAIIAQSDVISLGIIPALEDLNIRIPEDVALVSYDDTMLARVVKPALTSIVQPKFEMGVIAGKMILEVLASDGKSSVTKTVIQPKLVIRESTVHAIKKNNELQKG